MTAPGPTTGRERIAAAFERTRAAGRAALVVYLPAGFPTMEVSERCLRAAAVAGADVLEVGFPFSDPMMDGPVIQQANQVALDQGYGVVDDLAMCARLTDAVEVPALAMTYYTIPDARGLDWFAEGAHGAGLSGVILPDLPVQEAGDWLAEADARGLATVFLASQVSTDERLARLAAASSGWVYATGLLGVTGVKAVDTGSTAALVARIREHTDLPVAVGVGVSTPEQAAEVARHADGVIVGTAAVRTVMDGPPEQAPDRVAAFVRRLRAGIEQA